MPEGEPNSSSPLRGILFIIVFVVAAYLVSRVFGLLMSALYWIVILVVAGLITGYVVKRLTGKG